MVVMMVGSILLLQRWQPFVPSQRLAAALALAAGMSFSLYLFHTPVLNMLRAVVEAHGIQLAQSESSILWYPLFALAGASASAGFWWLFERHTMTVRRSLERRFKVGVHHQPIPPKRPDADGPPLPVRQATQLVATR